jgi:hypothetical protein
VLLHEVELVRRGVVAFKRTRQRGVTQPGDEPYQVVDDGGHLLVVELLRHVRWHVVVLPAPAGQEEVRPPLEPEDVVVAHVAHVAVRIQDALRGYSYRVLNAIEQTLLALASIDYGDAQAVQEALPAGVTTGISGVRSSLANMVLWKLAQREVLDRRTIYTISPISYALVAKGHLNRKFLAELLEMWLPYSYFKRFLEIGYYKLNPLAIIQWFRQQYEPFFPYAKSLFNPNKVDGLIHIYRNLN